MLNTCLYHGGFLRIYNHGNRNSRRTSDFRPQDRRIEIIGKLLYTTNRPIGQVSGFLVYIIRIIIIVILLFPWSYNNASSCHRPLTIAFIICTMQHIVRLQPRFPSNAPPRKLLHFDILRTVYYVHHNIIIMLPWVQVAA